VLTFGRAAKSIAPITFSISKPSEFFWGGRTMNCPSCSGEITAAHRFCPCCGVPVSSLSQAPTATAETAVGAKPVAAPVGRLISSDSLPVGGFTPGTVLAGRYRVIGLIGRGGMGEVYRADDLKLGQPVALKFLPKALADDPIRRERLFAEVRIARQVSHPNICRVYDIGELEGRHFLTMEYIDGEDLASLLKRIGNLHGTKALDVARQLCAGLAAAHDKGVLHRDLKPANVMIDGRGHVRITDFGLAVAAGEEITEGDVSGTPPYMAPEQFAGKGASVRSDIYALGLIFYEVFTGRRAFDAQTLAELRQKKETSSPTAPSEIARDIDPIVERVILRCIDKDPLQRPASAVQVAAALPGGDPLAAAIAAGETPSPEMVAASGSTEGLKPWVAWICLALTVLCIGIAVLLGQHTDILHRVPVEQPPEVMTKTARDILKKAACTDPPADSASGFIAASEKYLNHVSNNDRSPNRFEKMPALTVQFWYRQSPRLLLNTGMEFFRGHAE
jgi:predicted Ser/Thr protein kinase